MSLRVGSPTTRCSAKSIGSKTKKFIIQLKTRSTKNLCISGLRFGLQNASTFKRLTAGASQGQVTPVSSELAADHHFLLQLLQIVRLEGTKCQSLVCRFERPHTSGFIERPEVQNNIHQISSICVQLGCAMFCLAAELHVYRRRKEEHVVANGPGQQKKH